MSVIEFRMYQYLKCFIIAIFVCWLCSTASAKVIIKEKTTYYTVTGNSGRAIEKSIQRHRIKGSASQKQIGLTRTKMTVNNIKWKHVGGKCSVKRVDVVLDIQYIIPKWKKTKSGSARLTRNWKKFFDAVIAHERMHGKIWIAAYSEMHRNITKLNFKNKSSCSTMTSKIQRLLRKAENIGDTRNKQFERKEKQRTSVIGRAFLNVVATK